MAFNQNLPLGAGWEPLKQNDGFSATPCNRFENCFSLGFNRLYLTCPLLPTVRPPKTETPTCKGSKTASVNRSSPLWRKYYRASPFLSLRSFKYCPIQRRPLAFIVIVSVVSLVESATVFIAADFLFFYRRHSLKKCSLLCLHLFSQSQH